MANYTHNYAALSEYPKGNRKIYAFLGASVDDTGMPIFPIGNKLPIVIHEFCHSFVNPEIKTITFRFSHPLSGQGYSFFGVRKEKNAFPETANVYYSDDNRTVVMEVTLEKGKEYQFIVSGRAFRSKEGVPVEDYEVNFATRK